MSSRNQLKLPGPVAAAFVALTALAALAIPTGAALELDRTTLSADGRASARVHTHRTNVFGLPTLLGLGAPPEVVLSPSLDTTTMRSHDGDLVIRAGHRTGTIELTAGDARASLAIAPSRDDADEDGLPDAAELLSEEDRAAFTAWFTAVAEAQATAIDDAWPSVHHDCAGLIRFAYREALKVHDASWLAKRKRPLSIGHPDVSAFHYPELPFLGDLPFRSVAGRFDPALPREEQFTAAAGARALWEHNTRLISLRLEDARAGDLLFFSVPLGTGSRMHSMILLGDRPGATQHERASRTVYHTGADGGPGEVRLVTLDELLAHPDPSWHPLPHNPRFLGVHRFELTMHEARSPLLSSLEDRAR